MEIDNDDLSPLECHVLSAVQEHSTMLLTLECLEPEVILNLVEHQEESQATRGQMAHIASCAICRANYAGMLETWRFAQEVRVLEAAAAAPTPVLAEKAPAVIDSASISSSPSVWELFKHFFAPPASPSASAKSDKSSRRLSYQQSLVPALGLAVVALLVTVVWAGHQNSRLRTQLAQQIHLVQTGSEKEEVKGAFLAPRVENLALLNENKETLIRSMSGPDTTPGDITLIYPPDRALLQEKSPRFRWKAVPDATSYVVTVNDVSRPDIAVQPSLKIKMAFWQMPAALAPGDVYDWGVEAYDGNGKVIAQSRFIRFLVLVPKSP